MVDESTSEGVATVMQQINRAWLDGRVEDIGSMIHPDIVMVLPGFAGRIAGCEAFLAGLRDFSQNATTHQFREHDQHVDIAGDTAVLEFQYEMVYELSGARCRATGRDLWVFQRHANAWLAVWRTMLDVSEEAA